MSFFGIGPMEMVVVAVVALMLFNPRELPKMLRSIAKLWGQLRATADEFKDTIMNADGVDEIQELVKGTKGQIKQVENDARRELMKARAEMRKAQQKLLKANQAKLEQKQQAMAAENAEDGHGHDGHGHDGDGHGHGHDGHGHDGDGHGHDGHGHDGHGHDGHGHDGHGHDGHDAPAREEPVAAAPPSRAQPTKPPTTSKPTPKAPPPPDVQGSSSSPSPGHDDPPTKGDGTGAHNQGAA